MTTSTGLVQRASAWLRKPLIVCGLVAGMAMGSAPVANAETFSFSYSGSGVAFTAVFDAVWVAALNVWKPTPGTIVGVRNGVPIVDITCHYCNDFGGYGAVDNWFESPSPTNSAQLDYILLGGSEYVYTWLNPAVDSNFAGGTEWAGNPSPQTNVPAGGIQGGYYVGYPYTSTCVPNGENCRQMTGPEQNGGPNITQLPEVPEINASAGFGALGIFFGFLFILREMFLRRRGASLVA